MCLKLLLQGVVFSCRVWPRSRLLKQRHFRCEEYNMGSLPNASETNFKGALFNSEPTADDHSTEVLYEIKKDPVIGRYMVASRDIQPGEVVFTDAAVAIGKKSLTCIHSLLLTAATTVNIITFIFT